MATSGQPVQASEEKQRAAVSSFIVAIALTVLKAVVGLLTNSLGIISEAMHSSLDLVAAATTIYAVRSSGKPPDKEHPYGHGKYESLSAVVEVLLLLATCAWIGYEAIERLFFRTARVEASMAGFVVMAVSVVLNFSRSRILYRVAKKHQSQALEADALHFSSDVLGSLLVIVGLVFVLGGYPLADPLAALGVVVVVVAMSLRLGRQTMLVLLDRAPEGLAEAIHEKVMGVHGVQSCGRVRVRPSGAQTFVDLEVFVDHSVFEAACAVADRVEESIRKLVPNSDIMVRTRPVIKDEAKVIERIRNIASHTHNVRGIHGVEFHGAENGLHVALHVEVNPNTNLEVAHDIASKLEAEIKTNMMEISEVATHIESADEVLHKSTDVTADSNMRVNLIRETAMKVPGVKGCKKITVHNAEGGLHLNITCLLDAKLSVSDAHELADRVENTLLARVREASKVFVHTEPCALSDSPP